VGKELPTEAEWEYAARGRLEGSTFVWGDESSQAEHRLRTPGRAASLGKLRLDGYEATSPTGSFLPNDYGLFDMAGNVWEWTTDFFTPSQKGDAPACCTPPPVIPSERFPRG
jgi:formylglycine-generating enzyme required for sulfatase activity